MLLERHKTYSVIGGMPEVVAKFVGENPLMMFSRVGWPNML